MWWISPAALACTCPLPVVEVLPPTALAPRNAVAMVHIDGGRRLPPVAATLRRQDQPEDTWAVRIEPIDDHGALLVPEEPLLAHTGYAFIIQAGESIQEFMFTTTEEIDTTHPELTALTASDATFRPSGVGCGDDRYIRLTTEEAFLHAHLSYEDTEHSIIGRRQIIAGARICEQWTGDAVSAPQATVTYQLIDAAGNASPWSDPVIFDLPDEPTGCGCSSSGPASWWMLLALGLVRRRP